MKKRKDSIVLTVSKIESKEKGKLFYRVANNYEAPPCWIEIDISKPLATPKRNDARRDDLIKDSANRLRNNLSEILTEYVLKDNSFQSLTNKEIELNVLFNVEPFIKGKISFNNLNKPQKGQYFDIYFPISTDDIDLFSDILYTVLN